MRVAIVGAGAWGTALANLAARAGHEATLVGRDLEHAAMIRARRENSRYLPGVRLAESIDVSANPADVSACELLLLAVPAQALRAAAAAVAAFVRDGVPAIACAKGIERGTGLWMTQVITQCLPANPAAILSGPSFAPDVAADLPTAVTVAAADEALAARVAAAIGTPTFRVYYSDDVRGVEVGGATKNVLAIAAGIVAGRRLGASAQAALIARSFAELIRLGQAYGARRETMTGLSGLGDLVLTCSTPQSRNFSLGLAIGRGESVAESLARGQLVEGAFTAAVLMDLARARKVEMPIAASVDAILAGRIDVDGAIGSLLARPLRAEG